MANFNLQISADVVAWYGAIIASIGLLLSALNFLRDRARIKVELTNGLYTAGGSVSDVQLILSVKNMGRRKITLANAGFLLENGYNVFFPNPVGINFPHELGEGKSASMFVDKSTLLDEINQKRTKIKYAWFSDATGKIYKTNKRIEKLTKPG